MTSRIRIGVDTEGNDLGFSNVLSGVKDWLCSNKNFEAVVYVLEKNIEEATRIMHGVENVYFEECTSYAESSVSSLEILRDINENIDSSNKRFAYTMTQTIYDTITDKTHACCISGHAGHLVAIGRAIEKKLGIFNEDIPKCFGSFQPNPSNEQRIMMDVGAVMNQDLFRLSLLGEYFMKHYLGIPKPKIAFLNIGSEETKGPPHIREAAQKYRLYNPDGFYGEFGFIEPDQVYTASGCNVVVCDAVNGNITIKAAQGAAELIMQEIKNQFSSSIITQVLLAPAMQFVRKIFMQYCNSPSTSSAIVFGFNSLMVKCHGSAKASHIYNALKSITVDLKRFKSFYDAFTRDAVPILTQYTTQSSNDQIDNTGNSDTNV